MPHSAGSVARSGRPLAYSQGRPFASINPLRLRFLLSYSLLLFALTSLSSAVYLADTLSIQLAGEPAPVAVGSCGY
jgi:hypothetical protein